MLSGMNRVLKVDEADTFGTRIVQKEVKEVIAIDFDPMFVRHANERMDGDLPLVCKVHELVHAPVQEGFDGEVCSGPDRAHPQTLEGKPPSPHFPAHSC